MSDPVAAPTLPVSVLIPAYNRADLLPRALASVAAQRPARPAEVIVVDDCSADDTAAVGRAAGAMVIRHKVNQGEGAARNSALRAAAHPWVALLDSDDEWLPGHLAQLWPRRKGHVILGSAAVAGGEAARGRLLGHPAPRPVPLTSPAQVVFPDNPLPASGVLVRRQAVLDAGGFRRLPFAADLDAWLRVLERGRGLACPEPGYVYHIHAGQVSQDKSSMRAHLATLLQDYVGRPWLTRELLESVAVVTAWDELRAASARGDRGRAARRLAWLLGSPRRLRRLGRLLRWRAELRQRATRLE